MIHIKRFCLGFFVMLLIFSGSSGPAFIVFYFYKRLDISLAVGLLPFYVLLLYIIGGLLCDLRKPKESGGYQPIGTVDLTKAPKGGSGVP